MATGFWITYVWQKNCKTRVIENLRGSTYLFQYLHSTQIAPQIPTDCFQNSGHQGQLPVIGTKPRLLLWEVWCFLNNPQQNRGRSSDHSQPQLLATKLKIQKWKIEWSEEWIDEKKRVATIFQSNKVANTFSKVFSLF